MTLHGVVCDSYIFCSLETSFVLTVLRGFFNGSYFWLDLFGGKVLVDSFFFKFI